MIKEIKIGKKIIKIKYVNKIPGERKDTLGVFEPGQRLIYIRKQDHDEQAYTLLHDIGTVATATWDINWDNSNVQAITLNNGGAMTLNTPTNPETGATYILKLIQGSSPSTVTWTSSIFKWASATPPVLSTSAGQIDIITLIYDGTNYYGSSVLNLS